MTAVSVLSGPRRFGGKAVPGLFTIPFFILVSVMVVVVAPAAVLAQTSPVILVPTVDNVPSSAVANFLLPPDSLAGFKGTGVAWADASVQTVPVAGEPFSTALHLEVRAAPSVPYYLQLNELTAGPVHKGDVLFAEFSVRSIHSATGEAMVQMVFEQAGDPYRKSVEYLAVANSDWQRFQVPFTAAASYGPGKAQINFRLGYMPQTLEIGAITLVNYQHTVKVDSLPKSPANFPGGSPGAFWRKDAQNRIERIRKADLDVIVTDAAGHPVPDARVSVKMTRQSFGFGSAVAADFLLGTGSNRDRYRAEVRRLFNRTVLESDLKWANWEKNKRQALDAVQWLRDNGKEVRGHNLVWPGWQWLPHSVHDLRDDPRALRDRVDSHITGEVSALKGQLVEWDVLNEPYANHALQDILGKESMVEWFKLAHQADPGPRLFINDYGCESGGGRDTAHQDAYIKTVQYLLDNGAPVQGIGLQSHFDGDLTAPYTLLSILDRFSKLGLPLESTEFDVDISDEQLQASYFRDFMTAFYSHPQVEGILMWGFWEGRHWRPRSALFRKDWSEKANGKVWEDLVLHQWWTDVAGQSDAEGHYRTRGFQGVYEITVSANGQEKTVDLTLPPAGQTVRVSMGG